MIKILFLFSFLSILQLLKLNLYVSLYTKSYQDLYNDIEEDESFINNIQKQLHQFPENSSYEKETSKIITNKLRDLGATLLYNWNSSNLERDKYEVIAQFGHGQSPCVAIVVGIDAPNITDKTSDVFRPLSKNCSHSSGNDINTAILIGVAKLLKKYESSIEGTVKLIFQPESESGKGALKLISDGLLTHSPKIDHIYGLKVHSNYEIGQIISNIRQFTGYQQEYQVIIHGTAGHINPHKRPSIDPIPVLSTLINKFTNIQISKNNSKNQLFISTGDIQSYNNYTNIIPGKVSISGIVNAKSKEILESTIEEMELKAQDIAKSYKCSSSFKIIGNQIPPIFNDPILYFNFKNAANSSFDIIDLSEPQLSSSDFSYYSNQIPSLFLIFGAGGINYPPLYSPYFRIDNTILTKAATLMTYIVMKDLDELNFNKPKINNEF